MKYRLVKFTLLSCVISTALTACNHKPVAENTEAQAPQSKIDQSKIDQAKVNQAKVDQAKLKAVVAARSADKQARDIWRKPAETLTFFQLEPGMTVLEGLPGGGWYTEILANYLGANGKIYGINYDNDMWPMFGFSEEQIKSFTALTKAFPQTVAKLTDNGIASEGYTFSDVPNDINGTVDRVILVRALHNLNRFEDKGNYFSKALAVAHRALKDDGLVGVVQHQIPESASAEGATGQRGYLKQSDVIAMFEQSGFELVAQSDLLKNPNDQPSEEDIVWRLPPSYATSADNPELKAKMDSIGESNRMLLLFKKQ